MKVTIVRTAIMYPDWWEVFQGEAVQVEVAGPATYRIDLKVLPLKQFRELVRVVAKRRKIPVDHCEARIRKYGCIIPAADVIVVEDEEGVLF